MMLDISKRVKMEPFLEVRKVKMEPFLEVRKVVNTLN